MTIAATAWAFSTEHPDGPLERLLLILLADDTDDFGVCVTRLDRVAQVARIGEIEMAALIEGLRARGIVQPLHQVVPGDPDFDEFDVLFLHGWPERRAMPEDLHPVYGAVACA